MIRAMTIRSKCVVTMLVMGAGLAPAFGQTQVEASLCGEVMSLAASATSTPPFINAERHGYGNVKGPASLGTATLCVIEMDKSVWRSSMFCITREVVPERAAADQDAERFAPMRAERDRLAEILKTCPQFASWTYKAPERNFGYSDAIEDHVWTDPRSGMTVAARASRYKRGSKGRYSTGYKAGLAFIPPETPEPK